MAAFGPWFDCSWFIKNPPSPEASAGKEGIVEQKKTFKLLLAGLAVMLVALPFVTTFTRF